jgi:nucleoside-diphosphate-sugar epimerase
MSVVVTGAAGFIGRHVVAALRRRGTAVVAVDRRGWTSQPGEVAVVADLADADANLDRLLHRARGVIHLAGCPGVRDRRPDIAVRRWRDNVLAGARVLETTPASTPVVVASSSSVYGGAGPAGRPRPCREHDPLAPRGGYARSKRVLERYAADRAAAGGVVAVARPFTVAGECQRADMAIASWIDALRGGRHVQLYGSGARRRDITDVVDVAEGLVRMLELRITATVNLGTGVTHRLDDVLGEVARACGVEPHVRIAPAVSADVATTRADVSRCQRLLGFVPTTDLPALVARQVRAADEARRAPSMQADGPTGHGRSSRPSDRSDATMPVSRGAIERSLRER